MLFKTGREALFSGWIRAWEGLVQTLVVHIDNDKTARRSFSGSYVDAFAPLCAFADGSPGSRSGRVGRWCWADALRNLLRRRKILRSKRRSRCDVVGRGCPHRHGCCGLRGRRHRLHTPAARKIRVAKDAREADHAEAKLTKARFGRASLNQTQT